jgi:hypothetical protein
MVLGEQVAGVEDLAVGHGLSDLRRNPSLTDVFERIEQLRPEIPEILRISRHDYHLVNECGRGNHRVLDRSVGVEPAKLGLAAEDATVHRNDLAARLDGIEPALDLPRLVFILLPRGLDAVLNLTERHGRKMQALGWCLPQPSEHCAMRLWSS